MHALLLKNSLVLILFELEIKNMLGFSVKRGTASGTQKYISEN